MDKMAQIMKQVHAIPSFEKYEETNVRNNTNCYSHALGATFPGLSLYRIGAISKKKPIDEKYASIEEIKHLLFLDCQALQLGIKESSLEEPLTKEEHKIALFVKIWANGEIGDYHFWRLDGTKWTEKWKGRRMQEIQDFQRDKLDYFPWNFVGIYRISKKEIQ